MEKNGITKEPLYVRLLYCKAHVLTILEKYNEALGYAEKSRELAE